MKLKIAGRQKAAWTKFGNVNKHQKIILRSTEGNKKTNIEYVEKYLMKKQPFRVEPDIMEN